MNGEVAVGARVDVLAVAVHNHARAVYAVAAVDKTSGQAVWKSPSVGEPASYVSPIVAEYQGLRMIITMSQESLIAVNADTGDLLWRFELYTERYVANCVTPIYYDGHVLVTGGYGKGCVLLAINVDGQKAVIEPVWRTEDLDNRHGGVVFHSRQAHLPLLVWWEAP